MGTQGKTVLIFNLKISSLSELKKIFLCYLVSKFDQNTHETIYGHYLHHLLLMFQTAVAETLMCFIEGAFRLWGDAMFYRELSGHLSEAENYEL